MALSGEIMSRAVFLDRDGVLNHVRLHENRPYPPTNLAELKYLEGAREATHKLMQNNYLVVVVTNQPDIARKTFTPIALNEIHQKMRQDLGIEHFYVCPHDDIDGCECRKPKAGLLLRAASDLGIDLKRSYMVGDRWKDIAAGQTAGCANFFINYNYREDKPNAPYHDVSSLKEAVSIILESND